MVELCDDDVYLVRSIYRVDLDEDSRQNLRLRRRIWDRG